jgi:hypothetical protein
MKLLICNRETEVVKIKPHELPDELDYAVATNNNIVLYGKSGTGKSQSIEHYAYSKDYILAKFNLSLDVPETYSGIPMKADKFEELLLDDKEKAERRKIRIEFFTKLLNERLQPIISNPDKIKIIFFDEINQAQPEVLNCLYGIFDRENRNWAGVPVINTIVVGAGNLNDGTDGTVYVNELPTPLHNRATIFELVPDVKDTTEYLSNKYKNIPQVKRYIKAMTDEDIPPRDIEGILIAIAYEGRTKTLEAKLGSGLARKILEIKQDVASIDPLALFKGCKELYQIFKENGIISFEGEMITKEKDLIEKFKLRGLSDEEIQSIKKGE